MNACFKLLFNGAESLNELRIRTAFIANYAASVEIVPSQFGQLNRLRELFYILQLKYLANRRYTDYNAFYRRTLSSFLSNLPSNFIMTRWMCRHPVVDRDSAHRNAGRRLPEFYLFPVLQPQKDTYRRTEHTLLPRLVELFLP